MLSGCSFFKGTASISQTVTVCPNTQYSAAFDYRALRNTRCLTTVTVGNTVVTSISNTIDSGYQVVRRYFTTGPAERNVAWTLKTECDSSFVGIYFDILNIRMEPWDPADG